MWESLSEEEQKERIRKGRYLYLQGISTAKIREETEIPYLTLRWHIYQKKGCWKDTAERVDPILKEAVKELKGNIKSLGSMAIKVLETNLHRWCREDKELDAKEMKLLSDILANTDRIARLEDSLPTEILENRTGLSDKEMKQEILRALEDIRESDPMGEYEEVGE